ncbi:neural-cadherin, partial [Hyalella azteca]|uniref:Neural-cadherin n=1 Tax=Hyalella azteca TaxID=294128 RepID=A0A979FWF9_HYAAZ
PLDRDAPTGQARWHLTVTATDGQHTASTDVVVNLKDVNDNVPVFPHDVIDAHVLENSLAGTTVVVMSAYDADDPHESDNARLSYSLLKNIIDESSGLPMFTVDRQTGALSTAVCCLDREHTKSYGIVLAATDGGGLQGTCSVNVNIDDVNDVPPSFVQSHVEVSVPEYRQPSYDDSSSHGISSSNRASSSHDASSSSVILSPIEDSLPNGGSSSSAMFSSNVEFPASNSRSNFSENFITTLVVVGPDESNVFAYRVVPRSGLGWQLVEVRAGAAGADLFSRVPLDFENPQHRAGLNFRVQVTDQVRCYVVSVEDVNDNPPLLLGGSRVQLPPMAGRSDKELPGLPAGSRVPFTLTLDDPDDLSQGHGPPFELEPNLTDDTGYRVSFNPGLVSAGGGVVVAAELLTLKSLVSAVSVPLTLSDAGSPPMRRQITLTLVPHSAESAHRDVGVVKIATVVSAQATSNAPIGRLPHLPFLGAATQRHGTNAETDAVSYKFWNKFRLNSDKPHPKTEIVFSNSSRGLNKPSARITWLGSNSGIHLDSDSGFLLLDPAAGLGRHEAKLLLSSTSGDEQELTVYADVSNIGVDEALRSTPVDLAILPRDLLTSSDAEEPNSDSSESLLDRLLKLLNQQLAEYSAEAGTDCLKSHGMSAIQPHVMAVAVETIQLSHDSHTRVWLLQRSPESQHGFSLESLIFQHQHKIEAAVGAAVLGAGVAALGECASRRVACRCCCRDIATLGQRWHLADAGDRSHAGPSLRIESSCRCPAQDGAEEERGQLASLTSARAVTAARQPPCSRRACRNGGKCLPHAAPEPRCNCPGHTVGPHCKLLTRLFGPFGLGSRSGNSSVPSSMVLPSLPTCSQLHITIFVLTQHKTGNILSSQSRVDKNSRLFSLLLDDGKPKFVVRSSGRKPPKSLTLQKSISGNAWHRLDIFWINEVKRV